MGLIDRMLADLIGKNTGVDSRMVRRLIRGKGSSLLLMGGAAALGAALSEGSRARSGGAPPASAPGSVPLGHPTPSAAGAAPPPPPLPPGAIPPLPVESAGAPPEEPVPAATAYPVLRAMVAAALADGELSDSERQTIHGHLDGAGLSPQQTAQIHRDLVLPPSPTALAAETDDPALREAMYRLAGAVVLADADIHDGERRWLDQLADAFGFGAARRAVLEAEIFPEV